MADSSLALWCALRNEGNENSCERVWIDCEPAWRFKQPIAPEVSGDVEASVSSSSNARNEVAPSGGDPDRMNRKRIQR